METERQVPSLNLGSNREVIEETLKVPLKVNGEEEFVMMKKLSSGLRNKIRSECSTIKVVAGQPQMTINESEIQEKILASTITDAPFDFKVESIKKLPADVVDYLYEKYLEFAEPSDKKKD